MRLIDADALEYHMLYKENWLKGTGAEAPAVWKTDVDNAPTIETIYDYRIEHLAFIASVMEKEGVTAEHVVSTFADIGRIVAILKDEFVETLRKAVEQSK